MKRPFLAILLMLGLACTASVGPPDHEADDLRGALITLAREQPEGGRIRLRDAWPGDWDRVAILGPYYSNAIAGEVLGFAFNYESVSPWINTEGGAIVVLAKDHEALAWFKVPSRDIGLCLKNIVAREDDEFSVFHYDDGSMSIGPAGFAKSCG